MSNFQTAYQRLMRTLNRPLTETSVLEGAKASINEAILHLQRDHAYVYTEILQTLTYPAATFMVAIESAGGGIPRNFISFQRVSADGVLEGLPIKSMMYTRLQSMRNHYIRTHTAANGVAFDTNPPTLDPLTVESAYRQDMVIFISNDNFGIYPRPTEVMYLLVNMNIWLPPLVNDEDTNFFLDYGMDVVQMLALKKMSLFMRTPSLFQFAKEEVDAAIATLVAWDNQLVLTPEL